MNGYTLNGYNRQWGYIKTIFDDILNFGTFETTVDSISLEVDKVAGETAIFHFFGDGELLEKIESNSVSFDWTAHGTFDKHEFFVEVSDYENVIGTIEWHYSLSGEIPVELGNLSSLEILLLNTNNLTGEIPAELGDLSNLERLWLYRNDLTGEIPDELGNLSTLEHLILDRNNLSGEIPVDLGDLSNLEILFLFNNNLTGYQLGALSTQPDLHDIRIYDNELQETHIDNILSDLVDSLSVIGRVTASVRLEDNEPPSSDDNGTATSGTDNTLTDTAKNWTVDEFVNYSVRLMITGEDDQIRNISSNDSDTITVDSNWAINPSDGDEYIIYDTNTGFDYVEELENAGWTITVDTP